MSSYQVYVKLRGRNKDCYRKIVSTEVAIFKSQSELIHNVYPYSPETILDNGDWFKIDGFSKTEFKNEIILEDDCSVDYASIKNHEYEGIEYLFVRIEECIFFQKIGKSKLVTKKQILHFGGHYRYTENAIPLIINEYPDAIYDSEKDVLFFKRIESISNIFKGIETLYREATQEEVESFLKDDIFELVNDFSLECVKKLNRKRIALAIESFMGMNDDEKKELVEYIGHYCPNLKINDGKISIDSDENLKFVMYGINQRFYTTAIGKEQRLANSVISLSQNNT